MTKIIKIMKKIEFPWASRKHSHPDPTLFKYDVCSGCGHLILCGHIKNKHVTVQDRSGRTIIEYCEIYAWSCAPDWDRKEIALDGTIRYYKDGKEVEGGNPSIIQV